MAHCHIFHIFKKFLVVLLALVMVGSYTVDVGISRGRCNSANFYYEDNVTIHPWQCELLHTLNDPGQTSRRCNTEQIYCKYILVFLA
jgi:hypothetical protein